MKILISKRKIVFLTLCISLLVLLLHKLNSNQQIKPDSVTFITRDDNLADKTPNEPFVYKCCTQLNHSIRTNVFFLKTHKTGSTTVQSVILRFAVMNSLDVMNVALYAYYLPISDFSMNFGTLTSNGKYHILADHVRYDSKLKSYQYPDTSMVTILRYPPKLFQSLYTFFRMGQSTGMNFQQFLNAPKKPEYIWGDDSIMSYRGYNQMSVDLGFDLLQNNNKTAIDEFISKIDREFDFVMITEHMEESLVLLANLMGWPLEYAAFLKLNSRLSEPESYSLTLQDEVTLLNLNPIDAQLYNHFLKKFRECVRQYGEKKLNDQVQQLKIINERFKNRCVAEEVVGIRIGSVKRVEYTPKNRSDLECMYSMQVTVVLNPMVQKVQTERLWRLNSDGFRSAKLGV